MLVWCLLFVQAPFVTSSMSWQTLCNELDGISLLITDRTPPSSTSLTKIMPKIEKLAFYFLFMKGLKKKKKCLLFYFGFQKYQKTAENIF